MSGVLSSREDQESSHEASHEPISIIHVNLSEAGSLVSRRINRLPLSQ